MSEPARSLMFGINSPRPCQASISSGEIWVPPPITQPPRCPPWTCATALPPIPGDQPGDIGYTGTICVRISAHRRVDAGLASLRECHHRPRRTRHQALARSAPSMRAGTSCGVQARKPFPRCFGGYQTSFTALHIPKSALLHFRICEGFSYIMGVAKRAYAVGLLILTGQCNLHDRYEQ